VPKYTGQRPTELNINGHVYQIPADVLVVPNLQALHTHPRHWGDDSLDWRPQRWITGTTGNGFESEALFKPPKGTYFPWSEGIRNCPGKKFAQVEFVATLVALLTNHVAEPVSRTGESVADARKRVLAVVKDSNVELLLQMRDPRSVAVRWTKRAA
jgi:cytochrome P450